MNHPNSTTKAANAAATSSSRRSLTTLSIAALALSLLAFPVSGLACCGIGPQYPDFHDDSPLQNDPWQLGNYATSYENMFPSLSGTLSHGTWVGSYPGASQGSITGFTLALYSDAGGQPGAVLASSYVAGNAGETFLQLDDHGNPAYQYDPYGLNFKHHGG